LLFFVSDIFCLTTPSYFKVYFFSCGLILPKLYFQMTATDPDAVSKYLAWMVIVGDTRIDKYCQNAVRFWSGEGTTRSQWTIERGYRNMMFNVQVLLPATSPDHMALMKQYCKCTYPVSFSQSRKLSIFGGLYISVIIFDLISELHGIFVFSRIQSFVFVF